MGAGAELLPRGTLLAAAPVVTAAADAAAAAVALLFEGNGAFLFETDAILLDIVGEVRSGYRRRLASAAEIVEVGKMVKMKQIWQEIWRTIFTWRCAQLDPRGINWRRRLRTTRG